MRYKFEEAKKIDSLRFKLLDIIEITYSDITQTGSIIMVYEDDEGIWYDVYYDNGNGYDVYYDNGEDSDFYARFDDLDLAVDYANDRNLFPNFNDHWRNR